jgi:hypothetical protein
MPSRFAARRAVSVAPFGLARLANRPFGSLLEDAGFDDAYLRRLDAFSCTGCHQGQAIAGFHALGFDRGEVPAYDRLAVPFSAYFDKVQAWRRHPDAAPAPAADERAAVAVTPGANGDACDRATFTSSPDPLLDRMGPPASGPCPPGGVCATSQNGFPGGLCASPCVSGPGCVAVPILGAFTACLDKGEPFGDCLARHSMKSTMPVCEEHADCRADYVCLASHVCAPPYVLPQLSVEHQPL